MHTAEPGQLVIGGAATGALQLTEPSGEDGPRVPLVRKRFLPPSRLSPEFSVFRWRHVRYHPSQPSVLVKDLIVARFVDRRAKDQSMTGVQSSQAATLLSPADSHCPAAMTTASRIRKGYSCVSASRTERHLVTPNASPYRTCQESQASCIRGAAVGLVLTCGGAPRVWDLPGPPRARRRLSR
jgi:hypothetical protein